MASIITPDSFRWETVTITEAKNLVNEGKEVYALYPDGGEALINDDPDYYYAQAISDGSVKLAVERGFAPTT